jgi:hypothetical protein
VIVTQAALLVAVQSQPAELVTARVFVPPAAGADWKSGVTLNEHDPAGCVTVNVCPATVSVPVRELPVEFAAAENVTRPLPVPDAPWVIVSQVALLVAVHVQPLVDVTVIDPEPPTDATD